MTVEHEVIDREGIAVATRKGVIAAILLAILTVIEYFMAENLAEPLLPLLPVVALKGWIILDTFMHIRKVFSAGDH